MKGDFAEATIVRQANQMKTALHAQAATESTVRENNTAFSRDVRGLFSGRRAGHLSRWLYSTPRFSGDRACGGLALDRAIEKAKNGSPYYVFRAERSIIEEALRKVVRLFVPGSRLIDLGPGSVDAMRQKVLPLVKAANANVEEYLCVDVSAPTLRMAKTEAERAFPSLKVSSLCRDFIQDTFSYGLACRQEVAAIFGLTLCNMTVDPRLAQRPARLLTRWLRLLRSHFTAPDSYLIVTQDLNHDPLSLERAYQALADHFVSVLFKVSRDLDVSP